MEYYNKIANGYDELYEEEQRKKIEIIKKYIKPKGKILDIGAGTGIVSRFFKNVVSLDPSKKMLEKIKGEKLVGKAEELPFKDKSFDMIISLTALHHADPKKAISVIATGDYKGFSLALLIEILTG